MIAGIAAAAATAACAAATASAVALPTRSPWARLQALVDDGIADAPDVADLDQLAAARFVDADSLLE